MTNKFKAKSILRPITNHYYRTKSDTEIAIIGLMLWPFLFTLIARLVTKHSELSDLAGALFSLVLAMWMTRHQTQEEIAIFKRLYFRVCLSFFILFLMTFWLISLHQKH